MQSCMRGSLSGRLASCHAARSSPSLSATLGPGRAGAQINRPVQLRSKRWVRQDARRVVENEPLRVPDAWSRVRPSARPRPASVDGVNRAASPPPPAPAPPPPFLRSRTLLIPRHDAGRDTARVTFALARPASADCRHARSARPRPHKHLQPGRRRDPEEVLHQQFRLVLPHGPSRDAGASTYSSPQPAATHMEAQLRRDHG